MNKESAQFTVYPDDCYPQRQIFSAGGQGVFHGPLNAAAAGDLHARHCNAAHMILPDNFRQLLGIISLVKLGTADQRDTARMKSRWNPP